MKKTVKIAFDVGQVLFHFSIDSFVNQYNELIPKYDKTAPIKDGLVFLKSIQNMVDLGRSNVAKEIRKQTASAKISIKLIKTWNECITPCKEMIDFKNELIKEGASVAILSNMAEDHYKYIKAKFPETFRNASLYISYQRQVTKPQSRFYKGFLSAFPQFNRCHYIDDLDENLQASRRYGFRPIRFCLPEEQDIGTRLEMIRKLILQ